jgi:hypothetical protein
MKYPKDFSHIRYNEKAIELSSFLGKKVKSAFRSDKNSPQFLLGLRINFDYTLWEGLIRYYENGYHQDRWIQASMIYIL